MGISQAEINSGKAQIADFYKSGVEQKVKSLDAKNRKLQRGIITEKDDITAAKIRGEQPAPPPTPPTVSTDQYIAIGVLGAVIVGLSML